MEVRRDVLFMICGLGVLSESFRQPLENRSGRMDVFRLGEESGCPDSVAFFEWFIWEVSFRLGRRLSFIFVISIFYEGWEGAGLAGVYPFSILPLCVLFRLAVGLTADTAARKASGHFDGSGAEVNLWIVLVQPGEPEYHVLLAEAGDREQNAFRVLVVGHDHVNDFADAPGLVKCSVHVVNRDRLGQLAGQKFRSGDEVLVDEVSGGAGIDHGLHGCFFHGVRHFQVDQEHDALRIQLERADDKLVLYPLFPFGPARLAGFGWQECGCIGLLCIFINFWFNNFKNGKSITT